MRKSLTFIVVFTILFGIGFALIHGNEMRLHESSDLSSLSCPAVFSATESNMRAALPTDSGMHALWVPSAFSKICNIESWEQEILMPAGIQRHIKTGQFVPLYVHSDGVPSIEVRIESESVNASLTEDERKCIKAESNDYLLVSDGVVNVSGIEYIGGTKLSEQRSILVPSGRWAVKVFFLQAPDSVRSKDALYPPDFLVIIRAESSEHGPYRESEETFDQLP